MEILTCMSQDAVHSLFHSVSELLSKVVEDILDSLDKQEAKSFGLSAHFFQILRKLLTEKLSVTAERLVSLLDRELVDYKRQKILLQAVLSPVVRLQNSDYVISSAPKTTSTHKNFQVITSKSYASPDNSIPEKDKNCKSTEISASKEKKNRIDHGDLTTSSAQPLNHLCALCGERFSDEKSLLKHAEFHTDSPGHLCGDHGQHVESTDVFSHHFKSTENVDETCEIYSKTFQNMGTHAKSLTEVRTFICDICGKIFHQSDTLRRHKKIHSRRTPDTSQVSEPKCTEKHKKGHNVDNNVMESCELEGMKPKNTTEPNYGETSLSCKDCGDSSHNWDFLRKQAETHLGASVSTCGVYGKQLDPPENLQAHLHTHRKTSGTCPVCRKSFQNIKAHMRSHSGIKPYCCPICPQRFPRPGALRRHKTLHSRPHVCRLCGKTFIESTALKTHSRSHSVEKGKNTETRKAETSRDAHTCKTCGETFLSERTLWKHVQSHSAESVCGVCGESLQPSEILTNHLQQHRQPGQTCQVCSRTYQNIQTHMRRHTGIKPYHCSICGKSFPRVSALRRHSRLHSGERPYICEFCGKTFVDNGALTAHIKNHTGDKSAIRVSCETCGKSLASVHVLEVHKRIHTGEKPFLCRVCGKAFRQVGGLNAHSHTHTGEKPFSCSLCSKSFSTKGYLETHIRFHKKEQAFSCHLCWKAFVTKNDLKKHLLTHTGEKPYDCQVCGKSYQEKRSRDIHMKIHLPQQSKEPIKKQGEIQSELIQL